MADLNLRGEVSLDTSNADAAFGKVEAGANRMAGAVAQAGKKAGEGAAAIGEGAKRAAESFTREEGKMRAAIQRATLDLQTLGKTASQKFEAKLSLQGLDATKFRPYLDALDQAKAKADAAAAAEERLRKIGGFVTAAAGAAALAASIAAIDFARGIKGVIDTADALGKLSQRTGIAIEQLEQLQYAAKLSGVDAEALTTSFRKLNQNLGEAQSGNVEKIALFKSLGVNLRDASGAAITADKALAQIANTFSTAQDGAGKTALAISALGKSGDALIPLLNGGAEGIARLTNEFGQLRGQLNGDTARAAEQFNDNLTRLQTASGELARSMAEKMLPGLVQITDVMVEQAKRGSTLLAVWAGLKEFAKIATNTDALGGQINSAKDADARLRGAGSRLDLLLKAQGQGGDSEPLRKEIALVRAEVERLQASAIKASDAVKSALNPGFENDPSFARLEDRRLSRPKRELTTPGKVDDSAIKAAISQYNDLIGKIRERIDLADEELRAGRPLTDAEKEETRVLALLNGEKGKLNKSQQEAVRLALDEAKAKEPLVLIQRNRAKADLEAATAREKYLVTLSNSAEKIAAEAHAERDATQRLGLTKEAIAALDAAKLELLATDIERQAIRQLDKNLDETEYRAQLQLAQSYRDLAEAKKGKGAKETMLEVEKASADAAKKAAEEWEKTADSINTSLTDALLRGFESGKGFAKNLRDTLVNMFKTLVLQPTIKGLLAPVSQGITGIFGGGGVASGGGVGGLGGVSNLFGGGLGGVGGMFGSFGSGGGILGSIGSSLGLGSSVGVGGSFASTIGGGLATDAIGATVAEGAAAAGLGGGTTGLFGGLGGLSSIAGPLAIGGLLLSSLLKGSGETRSGGQYEGTQFVRGPSGGEIGGDGVRQAIKATQDGITTALKQLGSTLTLDTLFSGLESSTKGKGFAFAGGTLSDGSQFGQGADGQGFNNRRGNLSPEQASAAFQAELEQATLQAIQAAAGLNGRLVTETKTTSESFRTGGGAEGGELETRDVTTTAVRRVFDAIGDAAAEEASGIPRTIRDKLRGVDIDSLGDDIRKQLLAEINSIIGGVTVLREAVATLPFDNLKNLTFDAAAGLIKFAGSVESLVGSLQTYYQNFFSGEEQRIQTAKNIKRTLDAVGGTFTLDEILKGSRSQFRQVVEAFQDRTDEAGQKFYVALLSVAGAFASITPEVQAVADTSTAYADALRDQVSALEDTINKFGGYADALKRFRQELTTGPLAALSPEARYNATKAEFDRLSALPVTNEERLQGLEGAGKEFLEASKEYNATSMQYFVDLAKVRGAVEASEVASRTMADIAKMQLSVAQSQLATLEAIRANTSGQPGTATPTGGSTGGASFGGSATGGGSAPAPSGGSSGGAGGAQQFITSLGVPFDMLAFAQANLGNPQLIADTARQYGITQEWFANATNQSLEDVRTWFSLQGVPAFDVGTNFVPRDTLAMVHQGEAIIPRAFNPWAGGGAGMSTVALEKEVGELRKEVSRLVALTGEGFGKSIGVQMAIEGNTAISAGAGTAAMAQPIATPA